MKTETDFEKNTTASMARALGGALIFVGGILTGFWLAAPIMMGIGDAGFEPFFQYRIQRLLPFSRLVFVVSLFFFCAVFDVFMPRMGGSRHPLRRLFVLFSPLFIICAMTESVLVFSMSVGATLALYIIIRLQDTYIFQSDPDDCRVTWSLTRVLLFALVVLLFPPIIYRINGMLLCSWGMAGLSWLLLKRNGWATVRIEGFFLLVCLLSLFVSVLTGKAIGCSVPASVNFFFFLVLLVHMVFFFRWRKRFSHPNILMLAIALFCVVCLEFAMVPLGIDLPAQAAETAARFGKSETKKAVRILGRLLPPGALHGNAGGWFVEVGYFRSGTPSIPKPPGVFRIIALGSSSTEGFGIDELADVWTSLLEEQVNKAGFSYRFEVVNAGVSGANSFKMLQNLKYELLRYDPDLILLYLGHNDQTYMRGPFTDRELFQYTFDPLLYSDTANREDMLVVKIHKRLSVLSTYRLLRKGVLGLRSRVLLFRQALWDRNMKKAVVDTMMKPIVPAVPPEHFAENIEEFNQICRKEGIGLAFFGEASQLNLRKYKEILERKTIELGLFYWNGNDALAFCGIDSDEMFSDLVHLSIAGNECFGRFVFKSLIGSGLIGEEVPE